MKYFTKEELMDITDKLLENPSRETLKMLSDKYNNIYNDYNPGVQSTNEVLQKESEPIQINPVEYQPVEIAIPNQVNNFSGVTIENTENSIPEPIALPNETNVDYISNAIPSFEMPKIETQIPEIQNNQVLTFNPNLFDKPAQDIGSLMQTTDNFNTVQNTTPSTEIPITPAQFFVANQELSNNPIAVQGQVNNQVNQTPSMFGQFEQNYM